MFLVPQSSTTLSNDVLTVSYPSLERDLLPNLFQSKKVELICPTLSFVVVEHSTLGNVLWSICAAKSDTPEHSGSNTRQKRDSLASSTRGALSTLRAIHCIANLVGCLTALCCPEYGHNWRVSPKKARLESGQQVFENCHHCIRASDWYDWMILMMTMMRKTMMVMIANDGDDGGGRLRAAQPPLSHCLAGLRGTQRRRRFAWPMSYWSSSMNQRSDCDA